MMRACLILWVGVLLAGQALTLYWIGPHGWDDGAITLAFARTMAEHGQFALNAASERVEGTSSLLFFGLAAVAQWWVHFGFEGLIQLAQFTALGFAALCAWLTYKALAPALPDATQRAWVASLLLVLPAFHREALNGMEMTLFAALMVCHVDGIQRSGWRPHLVILALLLTRFESVFYLAFSLLATAACCPDLRPAVRTRLMSTAAGFAAITAARKLYFGEWVPNTVLAKTHAPYAGSDLIGTLVQKGGGLAEFIDTTLPLSLAIGVLLFTLKGRLTGRQWHLLWVALAFLLFSTLAGKNWGYPGRMTLAAMPVLVLLLAELLPHWPAAAPHRAWVLSGLLLCLSWTNRPQALESVRMALAGGLDGGRLPPRLSTMLSGHADKLQAPWVTPANYRAVGQDVDDLRQLLGLDTLVFMVPDVGGLGLCCARLRIVDLALLTNHTLAKSGYRALPQVIASESPDVIETHSVWSVKSGIYQSPALTGHYTPVVYRQRLLWLANRHLPTLGNALNVTLATWPTAQLSSDHLKGQPEAIDLAAVKALKRPSLLAINRFDEPLMGSMDAPEP